MTAECSAGAFAMRHVATLATWIVALSRRRFDHQVDQRAVTIGAFPQLISLLTIGTEKYRNKGR